MILEVAFFMADETTEKAEKPIDTSVKARYWWAVLYQENMVDGWRDNIEELLQLPYAYCEHVADVDGKGEHRWESALERDEWPSGWVNVGEIVEGKLPKAAPETVTLSLKVPAAMKRALEKEAKAEGKSTGAYARGILADGLMAIA